MGYYMDRAAQYLHVVVSLLVFFAQTGDAVVKAYMAKAAVLEGLVAAMEFLPSELILEICASESHRKHLGNCGILLLRVAELMNVCF